MFCVASFVVLLGRFGFHEPFLLFSKLVDVVAKTMGDVFLKQSKKRSKKQFGARNRLTRRWIEALSSSMRPLCRPFAAI